MLSLSAPQDLKTRIPPKSTKTKADYQRAAKIRKTLAKGGDVLISAEDKAWYSEYLATRHGKTIQKTGKTNTSPDESASIEPQKIAPQEPFVQVENAPAFEQGPESGRPEEQKPTTNEPAAEGNPQEASPNPEQGGQTQSQAAAPKPAAQATAADPAAAKALAAMITAGVSMLTDYTFGLMTKENPLTQEGLQKYQAMKGAALVFYAGCVERTALKHGADVALPYMDEAVTFGLPLLEGLAVFTIKRKAKKVEKEKAVRLAATKAAAEKPPEPPKNVTPIGAREFAFAGAPSKDFRG